MAFSNISSKIEIDDRFGVFKPLIFRTFENLYNNSASARALFSEIENRPHYRIELTESTTAPIRTTLGGNTLFISLDFFENPNKYIYIDDGGTVRRIDLERVLVHESVHALGRLRDTPNNVHEPNFPNQDYVGQTVEMTNAILLEYSQSSNIRYTHYDRVSYTGREVTNEDFAIGQNLTWGKSIDVAAFAKKYAFLDQVDFDTSLNTIGVNDLIIGRDDANKIKTGAGDDFVYSFGGNDHISGGKGRDVIYTGEGDDYASGGYGKDIIYGEGGNDTLFGDHGADVLVGGDGDDYINGGITGFSLDGQDYLIGGRGDDTIFGFSANDVLLGDEGDDLLVGGSDNDWLHGGEGNDTLGGGGGEDTLIGNKGVDHLQGGRANYGFSERDTFVFFDDDTGNIFENASDIIQDLEVGDLIRLPNYLRYGGTSAAPHEDRFSVWQKDGDFVVTWRTDTGWNDIRVEGDLNPLPMIVTDTIA